MQLSPSNVPSLDSNLLALLLPGPLPCVAAASAEPGAMPPTTAGGDGDAPAFEQFLAPNAPAAKEGATPIALSSPATAGARVLETMPFSRFVGPESAPPVVDETAKPPTPNARQPDGQGEISAGVADEPLRRELRPKDEASGDAAGVITDPTWAISNLPNSEQQIPPEDTTSAENGADHTGANAARWTGTRGSEPLLRPGRPDPHLATGRPEGGPYRTLVETKETSVVPEGARDMGEHRELSSAKPAENGDPADGSRRHEAVSSACGAGVAAVPASADKERAASGIRAANAEQAQDAGERGGVHSDVTKPGASLAMLERLTPASATPAAPGEVTLEHGAAMPIADVAEVVSPGESVVRLHRAFREERASVATLPSESPNIFAGSRGLPLRGSREANFAEPGNEFRVNFSAPKRDTDKTFVSSGPEEVTRRTESLGIDVAKSPGTMSSRALPTPILSHPTAEYASVAVAAPREVMPVASPDSSGAAADGVASAHRAVEAVLRAVDHVATRDQHSVDLRFSIGDADLRVRVELRADEVRTTFTTDSADLRTALSHEWQALAHGSTDSAIRIAPATFTSASDQPASQTFSGDASSRDREQPFQQQHQHGSREAQETLGQGGAGFSSSARRAHPDVPAASAIAPAGSRRLHTLA